MQIVSATDCTIKITSATKDSRLAEGMEASVTAAGSKKDFPAIIRKIEQNSVTLYSDKKPEELTDGTVVEVTITPVKN